MLVTVRADLKLVTSNDYLRVLKRGELEPIVSFEVAGFKNYNFFGVNNTVKGAACYMQDSEIVSDTIKTQCFDMYKDAPEDLEWVLIIPFDNQRFVSNLNKIPSSLPGIKSVIFTYSGNPQISSPAPDQALPEIISFAKKTEIDENKIQDRSFPVSDEYYFEHEHSYIEH